MASEKHAARWAGSSSVGRQRSWVQCAGSEYLAKQLLSPQSLCNAIERRDNGRKGEAMLDLGSIKITPRDEEVLQLLLQGCSNKEIAEQLRISPRTVKQHLRTLFLRAGIRDGRKRVKLATAMFQHQRREPCSLAIG